MRRSCKFGENVKSLFYLSESIISRAPGVPKMVPWEPRGAQNDARRARNRKIRKHNTLIYFCPCRVDPAAVTSPCSSIWEVFWGSPGGARHILGRPRPPENVPGIVPGIPFGLHRAPCRPRARLPGLPRALQGSPQGSPSRLGWPGLDWPGWLVGLAEAGVSSQVQRKIHNICWSGKAPRSHPPSARTGF